MAGKRKFAPGVTLKKITLLLPAQIDRDLRRHAHQTGQRVGPVVREWIITALQKAQIKAAAKLVPQPPLSKHAAD